jgi:hypothetical protein
VIQSRRPKHGRDFARGAPAAQVHLEKAILPMNETEAENDVEPIAGGQGRHAQIVAIDYHGCP